ncbi:MAG: peptidylprolyl isomerase, partial [Archangiaceae bacterium]|nr:peptidylprolyl isomerase [Archangiaceae bacterium]
MRALLLGAALLALAGCPKNESTPAGSTASGGMGKAEAGKPIFAVMKTSLGDITIKFYADKTPKTVSNFVGLASGEKDWKNPATGERKKG